MIQSPGVDAFFSEKSPIKNAFQDIVKNFGFDKFSCPVIVVAGTNGKGSCVSFLENVYAESGYKVGSFYSPHLFHINERIRVNKKYISDSNLRFILKNINYTVKGYSLSFFELATLMALTYFSFLQLDVIILEVGLGGKLDPVSIVKSKASMITSIGLDHQKLLGNTREKIAKEKLGVYKIKKIAICGDQEPPEIIEECANRLGSSFYQIDKNFGYTEYRKSWNWYCFTKLVYIGLPVPNIKIQNAATSIMALTSLQRDIPIEFSSIENSLINTKLSGRFEKFSCGVIDVAHNSESVKWLNEQLLGLRITGRIFAIFSMLEDREVCDVLKQIIHTVSFWYLPNLRYKKGKHKP